MLGSFAMLLSAPSLKMIVPLFAYTGKIMNVCDPRLQKQLLFRPHDQAIIQTLLHWLRTISPEYRSHRQHNPPLMKGIILIIVVPLICISFIRAVIIVRALLISPG